VPEAVTRGVVCLYDERRFEVPVAVVCPEFRPADARGWIGGGQVPELARARHVELVDIDSGHWPMPTRSDELTLKHSRAYRADPPPPARWRIACIFVDKTHRGQGIARVALRGALDQIAGAGGGLTEVISETTVGRQAQGRFLFSATVELFEQSGFTRCRQVGKHAWIASRLADPARRHTIDLGQQGTT